MGYTGYINDKGYIKSKFCRPYKFLVHCVIHALSHRKGGYDESSDYMMNIIACLVLNRPYNISQVIFNHMMDNIKGEKYVMYPRFVQMLLDDQILYLPKDPSDELPLEHMDSETLKRLDKYRGVKPEDEPRYRQKFGKIKKSDYVAPEGDNWRHTESNLDNETERLKLMVEKKLRFWFVKDEKKKKRTPKVSTPKIVIKGKLERQESSERLVDISFEYYTKNVNICVAETKKKKSPPCLVDEPVIPPTEMINEGIDLLKMSFADYEKRITAESVQVEKEAEKTAENVEAGGENVEKTFVEGLVHIDSSETESDFDTTKIAPTPYVSGKQKLRKFPKKKKASDEEDATYVPTPADKEKKKKGIKKRKARPTGELPRSVRARKETMTYIPQPDTTAVPEVPEFERVETVESPEIEITGVRQSTPPPSPINKTIHISPDHEKTPVQSPKNVEDPTSATKKFKTSQSSSHSFPKIPGDFPFNLPSDSYDMFNDGKVNVLMKKVSVLEKAKAKLEAELKESKEKLEAVEAENVALRKEVEDHACHTPTA
ncbi:hypothetical protein HanOQP8_Chr01g0007971 [Helianthus annuus]|nr:hypothetical protein HanOQP8_Chr01g0007971 [Helianthus annuus]